ncbi:MAG: GIY-YIG nuclease family protein [Sphingobacteriaceae bacterium]|nr:MAG: GIY-YIG nuclease family protein [Sphingobacteriaceae bacterium]
MISKQGHVYIMSNQYRTTFYIGVTSDLEARVWQHSNGEGSVFTKKYKCFDLVYYEHFPFIIDAIDREKQLKNWHRPWKIALIESVNPKMLDLKEEIKS